MREIDYIVDWVRKYLSDKNKYASHPEFLSILDKYPFVRSLLDDFTDFEKILEELRRYSDKEKNLKVEHKLWKKIEKEIGLESPKKKNISRKTGLYAIAACFLLALLGVWWIAEQPSQQLKPLATDVDFTPGDNKAYLELADGRKVELSALHEGLVIGDGISYDNGSALGELDSKDLEEMQFLTLSVPKGGKYKLTLSDGTQVWLNADSKLKYPIQFRGNTREVELEGEAYFEVARQEKQPFYVKTKNEKVKVLGTHFNVSVYEEDRSSRVSLLEGSVEVSVKETASILKPGTQSVVRDNQIKVESIDVDEVMAWKNDEFIFNHESLESVMRKVARWYDLEISVSPELQAMSIWGSVSRYDNFNKVLELIKMTDENIRYKVKGRKVCFVK